MNDLEIIEQLTDVVKKQADIILCLYSALSQHMAAEEMERYAELIRETRGE